MPLAIDVPRAFGRPAIPNKTVWLIHALRRTGQSYGEIAKKTGVSRTHVQRIATRAGRTGHSGHGIMVCCDCVKQIKRCGCARHNKTILTICSECAQGSWAASVQTKGEST